MIPTCFSGPPMVSFSYRKRGDLLESEGCEADSEGHGLSPHRRQSRGDAVSHLFAAAVPADRPYDQGGGLSHRAGGYPPGVVDGGRPGLPLQGLYRLWQREGGRAPVLSSEHGRFVLLPVPGPHRAHGPAPEHVELSGHIQKRRPGVHHLHGPLQLSRSGHRPKDPAARHQPGEQNPGRQHQREGRHGHHVQGPKTRLHRDRAGCFPGRRPQSHRGAARRDRRVDRAHGSLRFHAPVLRQL